MDSYVANPALLNGTPKRTFGELARKAGFRVPQIYGSLADALQSGKEFMLRSENWREYDGASGILDSYSYEGHWMGGGKYMSQREVCESIFEKYEFGPADCDISSLLHLKADLQWYILASKIGKYSQEEVLSDLLAISMQDGNASLYCQLAGIDPAQFVDDTTFSFWEQIDGSNGSIVADSAIEGRYHILAKRQGYFVIEGDKIQAPMREPSDELRQTLLMLPQWYECARRLPGTDPNHCPLIEFQMENDVVEPWFLQYHRTRDFSPATHSITRPPASGEIVATLVRGSTPPEGIAVRKAPFEGFQDVPDTEIWIGDQLMAATSEVHARKVRVQTLNGNSNYIAHLLLGHTAHSLLFKPEVTLGVEDWEKIVCDGEWLDTLHFHVVADGNKAYVRRLN